MSNYTATVKKTDNGQVRTVTVALFDPNDGRQATEAAPHGIDSNPVKGAQAVYFTTSNASAPVTGLYTVKEPKALPGELRLYATNAGGTEQCKMWLHANGNIEVGGTSGTVNANHGVQYEGMDSSLQALVTAINAQLTLIQTGITGVGGVYPKVDVTINTTGAKLNKILVE